MKQALILIFLLIAGFSFSQKDTLHVKTSISCSHCAVCETCGELFETELYYVKGIKYVAYNESDTTIMVVYKAKKTNPETIRKKIAELGYDADHVSADPAGYAKLDACCKREGE